jgi:hypothetical protein
MADVKGRRERVFEGERVLQDLPEGARKGEYKMKQRGKLLYIAVVCALMIPLAFAGIASARYLGDGAVPDKLGGWNSG